MPTIYLEDGHVQLTARDGKILFSKNGDTPSEVTADTGTTALLSAIHRVDALEESLSTALKEIDRFERNWNRSSCSSLIERHIEVLRSALLGQDTHE